MFDISMKKIKLEFYETLSHTITTLPCYASTIIFRVTAFSLTIAYLRLYSIIPILLLFLELAVISYRRYQNVHEKSRRFAFVYLTCLSNAGVLNANNIGELNSDIGDRKSEDAGRRFIRISSIVTFVHHTGVLTLIMIMSKTLPEYFKEGRVKDVILRPDSPHFFWVFAVTILVGFQSCVFALSLARKVSDVKGRSSVV
jgi:hypothetical protein